jgi:hypothetical protein
VGARRQARRHGGESVIRPAMILAILVLAGRMLGLY